MAQQDISSRSIKGKEFQVAEVNGEGPTQSDPSSTSWLIQIKSALDLQETWHVSKKVCIYRVPQPLISSNPKAYAPFVVSFGPYHHRINNELFIKDKHKLEALQRTSARLKKDVSILVAEIRMLESKIRECYDEAIDCDGETLSYMLAMDACFILECFRCSISEIRESDINRFSLVFQTRFHDNTLDRAIKDDILKLENQIPLIVLITLLQLEFGTLEDARKMLADLLYDIGLFCGYPFSSKVNGVQSESEYGENLKKMKKHIEKDPCHLLDLYRMVVKDLLTQSNSESNRDDRRTPSPTPSPDDTTSTSTVELCSPDDSRSTPSAELLHKTGIEFKPGLLGFEKRWFGKSTLFFPQITVEDSTETLLRNLMAYEECQLCSWKPEETVISHYMCYLDDLIDSEKDVSVLRKSLVIRSLLGSDDDIARMFNRLGDGITFCGIEEIEKVMKDSREHYKSLRKVWMSQFKEEHCSKPWYVVSLVAAILILGMTAVQAVYSVKK